MSKYLFFPIEFLSFDFMINPVDVIIIFHCHCLCISDGKKNHI